MSDASTLGDLLPSIFGAPVFLPAFAMDLTAVFPLDTGELLLGNGSLQ